jgi:hypothetical protein
LPQPNPQQSQQPTTTKIKEPGKCWGYGDPWTPEHKFACKFRKTMHAMSTNLDSWLEMEQEMEEHNHALLQDDPEVVTETP